MNENLLKRARKKYLSTILARELSKLSTSPLARAYRTSLVCCDQLHVGADQQLRSLYYCKRRWCQTCASINMSIQIDNYHRPLSNLNNLQFVTLTRRSVQAIDLPDTIQSMQRYWRQITDLARKKNIPFNGVRKLELKIGKGGHGYHPHYHIIMESRESAEWLVTQWLKRSTDSVRAAQDIRAINSLENALLELMKYATKLTCADKTDNQVLCTPRQMDVIFRTLHRKRLFQPFGTVRVDRSEDDFDATEEQVMRAQGLYQWIGTDWFHTLYGHPLANYNPEGTEVQIYQHYKH